MVMTRRNRQHDYDGNNAQPTGQDERDEFTSAVQDGDSDNGDGTDQGRTPPPLDPPPQDPPIDGGIRPDPQPQDPPNDGGIRPDSLPQGPSNDDGTRLDHRLQGPPNDGGTRPDSRLQGPSNDGGTRPDSRLQGPPNDGGTRPDSRLQGLPNDGGTRPDSRLQGLPISGSTPLALRTLDPPNDYISRRDYRPQDPPNDDTFRRDYRLRGPTNGGGIKRDPRPESPSSDEWYNRQDGDAYTNARRDQQPRDSYSRHRSEQGQTRWYPSYKDRTSWKSKKSPASNVSYVIDQVERYDYVFGKQWYGPRSTKTGSPVSLAEFKRQVTKCKKYRYLDTCTRYFLIKHNLSPYLQALIDDAEEENGIDDDNYDDPYDVESPAWHDKIDNLWTTLTKLYGDSDGPYLEDRWAEVWLRKGTPYINFYSDFETLSREVARSRGYTSMSEQEKRSKLYRALPAACQKHLREQGFTTPGALSYTQVTTLVKAWCNEHWVADEPEICQVQTDYPPPKANYGTDHHEQQANTQTYEHKTYSAPTNDKGNDYNGYAQNNDKYQSRPYDRKGKYDGYSKTNRFPRLKDRRRDDETILANALNKEILAAKCGRCLDPNANHEPATCFSALKYQDQRCIFCGLVHDIELRCPVGYDSFGQFCKRCGRKNHASLACKAEAPNVQGVMAIQVGNNKRLEVDIRIEDNPWQTALLDSGAMVSVIHLDLVRSFGLSDRVKPTTMSLKTADLGCPQVSGVLDPLAITFTDGTTISDTFVVVSSPLAHPLILSTCPLVKAGAVWLMDQHVLLMGPQARHLAANILSKPMVCHESPSSHVRELCGLALVPPSQKVTVMACDILKEHALDSVPPAVTDDFDEINAERLTDEQRLDQALPSLTDDDNQTEPTDGTVPSISTGEYVKKAILNAESYSYDGKPLLEMPIESVHKKPAYDEGTPLIPIDFDAYFSEDDIKRFQDEDPKIAAIKLTFTTTPDNEIPNKLRSYSVHHNDILYYHGVTSITEDNHRTFTPTPVLPRAGDVDTLLKNLHEMNDHCVAPKLLGIFRTAYYVPTLRGMVRRLLYRCGACQRIRMVLRRALGADPVVEPFTFDPGGCRGD